MLTEPERLPDDGAVHYCDAEGCHAEACYRVPVAVEAAGDESRFFCYSCYQVYIIGVQYGRMAENPRAYR